MAARWYGPASRARRDACERACRTRAVRDARYGVAVTARRPRARPRGLHRAVRPAADARAARGGRPARGRAGRGRRSPTSTSSRRAASSTSRSATEFLVLIAALLELKSRLMLPREDEELLDLEPGEAAEELLARMLEARRYRARGRAPARAGWPRRTGIATARAAAAVAAPGRPRRLPRPSTSPSGSAPRIGGLLRLPPRDRPRATSRSRASRSPSGSRTCARCCARGATTFDEAVARRRPRHRRVTLFALLELYKQGEATWTQDEPFGEIAIVAGGAGTPRPRARGARRMSELARTRRGAAVPVAGAGRAGRPGRGRRVRARRAREALWPSCARRTRRASAGSCCASSPAA